MSRQKRKRAATQGHADSVPVGWNDYDRIPPGEYPAYCKWAKYYRDRSFKRWTCLLIWEVLSNDHLRVLARVPQWFSLGGRVKPHASRRGKYFPEWIRANEGPPARHDRLSPNVFLRRMARVEVGDTGGPAPYSVVRRIIEWASGFSGYSVSRSHNQGEPPIASTESEVSGGSLSDLPKDGERDGVKGKPKRFSLPASSEDVAFRLLREDADASGIEPLSRPSGASALAGVEGEHTPAHTQGAGVQETANPPKAHQITETSSESPECIDGASSMKTSDLQVTNGVEAAADEGLSANAQDSSGRRRG